MTGIRTVAAACVLVVASAAAVGQASLEGQVAPEIQASGWIHGDGRTTLADFRGEVVLLEFWKTRCGASRGDVRHLVKLKEEYGRKGLEVVALTCDDDRRSLERFLTHADPSPNYRIAIGGAAGYAVKRLPCAVLVGADGKVVADGTTGRSISDKDVEAALKQVRPATPEAREAAAAKRLAFADAFAEDRLYARAERELERIAKLYPGTAAARTADERLRSFDAPEAAAELAAQKDVAKLAGLNDTLEHAEDRPSASQAEALAKRLAKKAEEIRAKTPRAARLAEEWAAIYAEPWK